jgi:cytochrome c553
VDGSPIESATLTSASVVIEPPTLKARMRDHDVHGAALRDAIERADLDTAHREAEMLAALRLGGGIEPTWRQKLDAMNAAAARVARANDLNAASRALAELTLTCGDCHTTLGGPKVVIGEPPSEDGGVVARMQRHQWAASRLWDGLVVPSDDAWMAGARVLADAPLEPELMTPGKTPVREIGSLAASVHELARNARAAQRAQERGEVYGELIATCADCHERVSGGPPPAKRR